MPTFKSIQILKFPFRTRFKIESLDVIKTNGDLAETWFLTCNEGSKTLSTEIPENYTEQDLMEALIKIHNFIAKRTPDHLLQYPFFPTPEKFKQKKWLEDEWIYVE